MWILLAIFLANAEHACFVTSTPFPYEKLQPGILADRFLLSRFGSNFVFPYIICGFYIILLLLRTYTASPTALSDASTNTYISEHSSGVHQNTFRRSYWLNAFSSSSSVSFLQVLVFHPRICLSSINLKPKFTWEYDWT
ncbi:hypothetical protein ACO02O_09975 [Dirofilaria immitis]